MENLQEEAKAAGGGLDGSLKGLLDDAAEVEEDDEQSKIRAAQAKRERTHTVEHHSAPEAMKALEAAGKLARGGEGEGGVGRRKTRCHLRSFLGPAC